MLDIVHRDLKLSNILLNIRGINKLSLKYIRFWIKLRIRKKERKWINLSLVGNPITIASEVLKEKEWEKKVMFIV